MNIQPVKYKAFCQQCGTPGARKRATHALTYHGYHAKSAIYFCPACLRELRTLAEAYTNAELVQ